MHRLDLEKLLETLNLEAATNEIPDATFDFGGCLTRRYSKKLLHRTK